MYEPDRIYEITTRTIQGRYLLRPDPEANDIIAGVIGRAQARYPDVRLYGVVILSNHCTWLLSSPIPEEIPEFMGFVNGNLSRELGRLYDWPGKMWERPARPIAVLDEKSLLERFEYLLAQGCKDDLVESPRDWPGVTCVSALLGERPLRGTWFKRDIMTKARRRGITLPRREYATRYTIRFHKIPCWEHLSDKEYAARVAEIIDNIEQKERKRRAEEGKRVLGVRAIRRNHPHHRPDSLAKSPAPLCHAGCGDTRRAFRKQYKDFVQAFRAAAHRLKEGIWPARFPLYSFPPRLPFVTSTA